MRSLNDEMQTAPRSGNTEGFVALNREFHFLPFGSLQSGWPLRFLNNLWDIATLLAHRHQQVLDAFADQELAALTDAMGPTARLP